MGDAYAKGREGNPWPATIGFRVQVDTNIDLNIR